MYQNLVLKFSLIGRIHFFNYSRHVLPMVLKKIISQKILKILNDNNSFLINEKMVETVIPKYYLISMNPYITRY